MEIFLLLLKLNLQKKLKIYVVTPLYNQDLEDILDCGLAEHSLIIANRNFTSKICFPMSNLNNIKDDEY